MATMTFRKSDRWLLPLSVILLVMGGLLGMQVNTQSRRPETEIGRRTSALGEMLRSNQVQVEAQKKEIESLRARLAKYETTATSDQGMTKLINEDLQKSRAALGLVPLQGPGLTLEISDATVPPIKGLDVEAFLVHDWDLIGTTNELWSLGAEAISLNGERLVAGSAFVCSGRTITVNRALLTAPFVFTVIGKTDSLMSGLKMPGGKLDELRINQLKVKLTPLEQVEVPAISVAPRFDYARPAIADLAQGVTK